MKKIKLYIEEAINELVNKVSWPTWKDLQNSAVIVMVASLIIGIAVYVMDSAFSKMMQLIYKYL